MNTQTPKFNIEQNNEELKVYMFTIQGGPLQVELAEDFKAVLAYNDQGAINQVRKDYPMNVTIHLKKRAQVDVKKIMDAVNIPTPVIPQEIKILPEPKVSKEKTVQDFIYGMLMVADKYVESPRDKTSLKRIINKIKIINEAQTTPKS